jgi:coenzyme F420 hydrogenase subunit beta
MESVMNMSSPALKRVLDANCCIGCGLCASLAPEAISMTMAETGYLRPVQTADVSSTVNASIMQHCPGISIDAAATTIENDVLWGPIVSSRTGHATDITLRKHASSGGVISALATHLVESKAVDFVVQVTASETSPIDNVTVRNINAETIYEAAGSRYAPSAPLEKLFEYLSQPGKFALVGKPCDIAALRSLAKVDTRIDKKIPYMISFFCAGIPSRKASLRIVNELGFQESQLKKFSYRGDGWPGFATAETNDGRSAKMTYAKSWGNILSPQVQFRCKICPDGSGGQADIVCGDAWESDERGYPTFTEIDGRSLLITRTHRGEELVQMAVAQNVIAASDLPVSQIALMQPFQARRKRQVPSRLMAMRLSGFVPPRYRGMQLGKAALAAGLIENIRGFWGTFRRLKKQQSKNP